MRVAALLLCLALAACQSLPPREAFHPLPPAAFGQAVVITQKVTGGVGVQQDTMLVQAEIEPGRLAMVASTPTGQVLFRLLLDGNELHREKPAWAPAALEPARVLADFQLAYWPLAAVQAGLTPGFSVTDSPDGQTRTLAWRGHPEITVHYPAGSPLAGPVQLQHHRWHYRLAIETLSVEPL